MWKTSSRKTFDSTDTASSREREYRDLPSKRIECRARGRRGDESGSQIVTPVGKTHANSCFRFVVPLGSIACVYAFFPSGFTVSPLSTSYARDRLRCAKTTAVFATIFASRLRAWKTTSRTHRVANDVIRCAFVRIITHRGCFQPLERLSASATFRENARQYLTV